MSPSPKLKRVFTGITLSTNDVRDIAHYAAAAGRLDIRANGARLMEVGQVEQVISEDVVLDRLTIIAIDGESVLEFSYEPSHVLARADDGAPRLREPFAAIVGLLEAKPPNGFGRCSIATTTALRSMATSVRAASTRAFRSI